MAWLTLDEGKAAVAAALHAAGYTELAANGAFWAQIIPGALSKAQQDITAILAGDRGLTLAQIDAWTGQKDAHRQQTIYWALVEGQGAQGLDPTLVSLVDKLDQRAGLENESLLDSTGTLIVPIDALAGPVAHGKLSTKESKFACKQW